MRRSAAFALALLQASTVAAELAPHPAEVVQPRAFGLQLGDMLEQRIRLEADGVPFASDRLPPLERIGNWFARRSATRTRDIDGDEWLVVRYQLINAPPRLQIVTLPGLTLEASDGGPALKVAAWPVSVAPIGRPNPFTEPGLGALRPDRPPATPSLAAIAERLRHSLLALAVVLAGWLGWWIWRARQERSSLPFARAWRSMRAFDDGDPRSWRALHRAFDASAGRVVDAASAAELFVRRPEFLPLAEDIRRFFRASGQRFFAGASSGEGVSPRSLCRALLRIERRHAR